MNCDDLAFLDGHLFMGCQNKTMSTGRGGNSTLVEYGLDGSVVNTWSIKDKIDGLGADPANHRVIATLDEDANSHLATIMPSAPTGQQLTNYRYSPDPHAASTPAALQTSGGTDHVSIDSQGHILVTGSHSGPKAGTAVFKVALSAPSSPTGTGTATLTPTFADNAVATKGNKGTGAVKLSLGDVDSGAIVPADSPRFGGSYVITDQTAIELVFASNIFQGTGLTVLKTPFGLDDILWTTSAAGTLYVVDNGGTTAGASAIYRVTGPFVKNTVLAANDGLPNQVAKVNLTTGALMPFIQHLTTAKGLVYLDPSGTATQLPLTGATTAATPPPAKTSGSPRTSKSSGSGNTVLIVVIIVVALVLLGGGGFARSRRSAGTS
ncbi:MAG: hypothetical protein ACR2LV_06715 [Solirubrobacteraceae bacterium]